MSEQKFIKKMTGYKATDANMKCRDFQFVLGEWAEITGEVCLCENGFHFCEQPSGPWCYYSMGGTRVFKCEAEDVLESEFQPGADYKRVCRRIRLVEEIIPTGDGNTGNANTGNGNTGNRNTGNANTGNANTGDDNTGNANTGNANTGYGNTGNRNTGDGNTGHGNTGDHNAGYRNTGYRNTGYGNTGDGNATNYSSGFFCQKDQNVLCFDVDTGMTRDQFVEAFPSWRELCKKLANDAAICYSDFANIPGITPEKLKSLHAKHIAARKTT